MYQSHHLVEFIRVSMAVICLLLLPATSSAGGLGDLFSGDFADKIKSIPIKDILKPPEKREDPGKPAPASQKNNSPAAAVAETKPNKPAASPASPAVVETKKDKPAKAPASPAVAKEAEGVKAWCYRDPKIRSDHDCECVADRFIEERLADPGVGKDVLLSRIMGVNRCPNPEGIRQRNYEECIIGRSNSPGSVPDGIALESYCQCVSKRFAKAVSGHKGQLGPRRRGSYNTNALMYCRRADAY